jgi:nucleoside-diphosphate-sugar epimerase
MADLGRILVTGANGQIGSEMSNELRSRYSSVVTSDIKDAPSNSGEFVRLDATKYSDLEEVARNYKIDTFFHLAAILSARGEENPEQTFSVNVGSLQNVLKVASSRGARVFWPSSIAVFGPDAPKINTPQDVDLKPVTMYGVTKVAGELLCNYYNAKHKLDVRCARLPGIISSEVIPSGGTTDYAVEMFYGALGPSHSYTCFVKEETTLPMMYMPDCIRAAVTLMEADSSRLSTRTGYNIAGMSFSAGELASEIKRKVPDFTCEFKPDYRQAIAETWPKSIDDSTARKDWNWKPSFDLKAMVSDMLQRLEGKVRKKA